MALRSILTLIREQVLAFHKSPLNPHGDADPVLRGLSSLAEGTDRLFASEAIALGYELVCPFPFPQNEYERDFAAAQAFEADSLDMFRALLACAAERTRLVCFSLDGSRADAPAAYAAAGRVILNQADILVVVWDGERLGKVGGTETILDQARARGATVVIVDARRPHSWRVEGRGDGDGAAVDQLRDTVVSLLAPPAGAALGDFFVERKPRLNPEAVWVVFRWLFGGAKLRRPALGVPDFETGASRESPTDASSPSGLVVQTLWPFYAWHDGLAVYYSNAYRGAFLLAYALAAAAVGLALAPVAAGWFGTEAHIEESIAVLGEIVAVLIILGLIKRGRTRRWHERWIDYRLGAELIRHLRLAVPLGGERPMPEVAAHLATYGQPAATWVAWYVRALERHIGLPNATIDSQYLCEAVGNLTTLLQEQSDYHQTNAERCHRLEHRLHVLGAWLLAATLLAAGLHLAGGLFAWMPHSPRLSGLLIATAAFLPALGAALAGISNQGEFVRIAKRSKAMAEHLAMLLDDAQAMQKSIAAKSMDMGWSHVVDITIRTTQLMVKEVLDWRVVFLDRPLNPPA